MLGHNGLMGEVGGNWRGGEGLRNDVGRLGLGARQFGLSERLGFRTERSLWGGGSLQPSEWPGLDRLDRRDVPLSSRSAGGTYRGGPSGAARFVSRKPSRRVAVM